MTSSNQTGRGFTEAARRAAALAKAAKRAEPDRFGAPELFIVKAGERAFTWELRRFGGIVLQRTSKAFATAADARASGVEALVTLLATPELPTFRRQTDSRAARGDEPPRC